MDIILISSFFLQKDGCLKNLERIEFRALFNSDLWSAEQFDISTLFRDY